MWWKLVEMTWKRMLTILGSDRVMNKKKWERGSEECLVLGTYIDYW